MKLASFLFRRAGHAQRRRLSKMPLAVRRLPYRPGKQRVSPAPLTAGTVTRPTRLIVIMLLLVASYLFHPHGITGELVLNNVKERKKIKYDLFRF